MALISWNKLYSVKISKFDEQHKELIRLINELHDAMMQSKTQEVMSNILLRLSDYTIFHFSDEEKLMEEYSYPDYLRHKSSHLELISQVKGIIKKHDDGILINTEVMHFLKHWLSNHILVEDKEYGSFFNSNGIN